jgi:hypothetical protein
MRRRLSLASALMIGRYDRADEMRVAGVARIQTFREMALSTTTAAARLLRGE